MEDIKDNITIDENFADNLSDIPDDYIKSEPEDENFDDNYDSPSPVPSCAFTIDTDREKSDWSDDDPPRDNKPFIGNPGPALIFNHLTIGDIVKLFIGDDLLEVIVTETNRYYHQNATKYKYPRNAKKWYDLTVCELKKWLALVILMGQVEKNKLTDYWSTNPLIETPIFSQTMTRSRFQQISTFLHFQNNEEMPANADRLFKVKNIFDYFSERFKELYKPKQNISLIETMIPWRGTGNVKLNNPNKITKYGILIRMVCESDTGYIGSFKMYSSTDIALENTIMELMIPYSNVWYHLYLDNYFTSVQIVEELLRHRVRVCGTIRQNRGIPGCLKTVQLSNYEAKYKRKGEILIQLWKNIKGKDFRLISTIHNSITENTKKNGQSILKPVALSDFNKYVNNIDNVDQYLIYYPIFKKTKKWTKKIFIYLINCALFNAFKIYLNLNRDCKIKFNGFLLNIAKIWIEDNGLDSSILVPSTSTSTPLHRLSMNIKQHHIVKMSTTEKRVRRKCRVCAAHNVRRDTMYMCKSCKVPLHVECFQKYHTKVNY